MKLTHTAVAVLMGLSAVAFAATPAQTTTTTTTKTTKTTKVVKHHRRHHHAAVTATSSQQRQIDSLQRQVNALQQQIGGGNLGTNSSISRSLDTTATGFSAVSTDKTAPFALLPDSSLTLTLLQGKNTYAAPVVIGGYFEGDAQYWNGSYSTPINATTNYKSGSAVYATTASLYALANLNSWTTVMTEFKGDFTASNTPSISKAFITFGNLNKSPLFAVIGKNYLPFGVFGGGGPWSNALQKVAFKPSETSQAGVGYTNNGLTTELSAFNNGTYHTGVQDFVYSVYYGQTVNQLSYQVGAGYMNDIRGTSSGIGAAYGTDSSDLNGGRNGVYDLNATVGYQQFALSSEFLRTMKGANIGTTGVNTNKMSALMVGGTYTPTVLNKPTVFGLSYSKTNHMSAVPMGLSGDAVPAVTSPEGFKGEWIGYASREVLNNVYVGPEYQINNLYDGSHTWTATLDLSAYF